MRQGADIGQPLAGDLLLAQRQGRLRFGANPFRRGFRYAARQRLFWSASRASQVVVATPAIERRRHARRGQYRSQSRRTNLRVR